MLAIYNGCQCPTGSNRITEDDDDNGVYYCSPASTVQFNAVYGNQYLIEVAHYYPNNEGSGVISISCEGNQNNDNCSNAMAIQNVVDLPFNTSTATFDGPGTCNINHSPNLWYLFTASCTGQAYISTCGSSFDTLLAVYTGTSCNNLTQIAGACNDNGSCGQQSELIINVTAGKSYWIEVSGFKATDKGQGILNVSCNGQIEQASDLGDAPDKTNHKGVTMKTYDTNIDANFPTVFQGDAIHGPIHLEPKKVAYLGSTVTYEDEADQGYDQDGVNNILPLQSTNNANRDLGDDCIQAPLTLDSCKFNTFDYTVKIVDPNIDMYVNVWFDWNRDGDWNDELTTLNQKPICTSCSGANQKVSEWAVRNQLIFGLSKGLHTITTPGFLAWNPEWGSKKIWMRITLSEKPFKGGSGAGGSGPASGYEFGETEDYYFTPNESCTTCQDWNGDGEIDVNDFIEYMQLWLSECPLY